MSEAGKGPRGKGVRACVTATGCLFRCAELSSTNKSLAKAQQKRLIPAGCVLRAKPGGAHRCHAHAFPRRRVRVATESHPRLGVLAAGVSPPSEWYW